MTNDVISDFMDSGAASTHLVEISNVKEKLEELIETPAVGVKPGDSSIPLDELKIDLEPTPRKIRNARTGVTPAGIGIADYGTITRKNI